MPRLGVEEALEGGGDDPGPYRVGFTGQSTSRVGAALPGPYVQATGAPLVDVELVEDIDVGVEVPRLLLTRLLLRQEASNRSCHLPPTSDPPQELELR